VSRPLYSVELFTGSISAGTAQVVGLSPLLTYVIRDITVFLESEDAFSAFLHVNIGGLTMVKFSVPGFVARTYQWAGRMVVPGASVVAMECFGTTAFANVQMSGYQLTPP
jgi:hypothetical protein